MLTDPKLRSQVDALWDKFWTGGLTNPLDAIEQFSYLLFLKRLDDRENAAERQAKRKGTTYQPSVKKEMRWSVWKQMKAEDMLKHLKSVVFPQLASLGTDESSFGEYMRGAECKINKPSLLVEAVNLLDQMEISQQNQDLRQGDTSARLSASLYEYLLSHLSIAGRTSSPSAASGNGQFRTPRHIIRMTSSPKRSEWDGADARPDPHPASPKFDRRNMYGIRTYHVEFGGGAEGGGGAGTGGFLINAHQHILEQATSKDILEYDADGMAHHLTLAPGASAGVGDQLQDDARRFMKSKNICAASTTTQA